MRMTSTLCWAGTTVALAAAMLSCSAGGATIVINEIAAAGQAIGEFNPSGSDWVELYNAGQEAVSLRGYRLHDSADAHYEAARLPDDVAIAAGGFLIVYFNRDGAGSPVIPRGLGDDEEVALYTPGGRVIDRLDWQAGDSPPGGSFGRSPDGGGVLATFDVPTPGGANR